MIFSLIIMFFSLQALGPGILATMKSATERILRMTGEIDTLTATDVRMLGIDMITVFASTALPLLLIGILVAVVFTMAQTRLLVSTKSMQFKFSRLNPLQGLKKMITLRALVELLKSVIKIAVLSYIVYISLRDKILMLPRLMDMSIEAGMAFIGGMIMSIVKSAAYVFVALAAMDYVYQWWDYEKNLRMSKQEVKEEYKQTEGDPQIKGQIRQKQRHMATQRMMQSVPKADVVIRNPTHYAVAIRYDAEKDRAPIVLAKGADSLALRIIAEAEKHGIVITENRPLARGLYESVEIDKEIPSEFYQAVAEVLVFVYSLKKQNAT